MGDFYFPVKIVSDEGCLKRIGTEVSGIGSRNPLIVADPAIIKKGILELITVPLKDKNVSFNVFEGVEPDPKIHNVMEAVNAVKNGNHDLLIGLGGGSTIDIAKAASVMSVNEGDIREFQGLRDGYPQKPLPLIGIPTTAGTGSEISSSTIITDPEKNFKMLLKSPQIYARTAFLDASVLIGIPSHIAASTGIDALTHALESYFNPNKTYFSEALSLSAVELIFENLRAFVADTRNRNQAQKMLNASCLAGMGMTTASLGLVHALAHPVGVACRISHGVACALLLPHVLRFNWLASSRQFKRLALAMDWTIRLECSNERDVVYKVIESVETLIDDIGLPKRLSDVNVTLANTELLVEEVFNSFLHQVNPRYASREQLEEILSKIV